MTTDTKTTLLNSAERAARTRGFDGFSYADLASDVGIRKASIHHHFPSKAALSVAVMERYYRDFEATCALIDHDHATGAERLSALIAKYRQALDGGQSLCLCVAFSISTQSLPAEALTEMVRFRAMMQAWISTAFALGKNDGTIRDVGDPLQEAAATLPLLEGAQLAARTAQDLDQFTTATQLLSGRLSL